MAISDELLNRTSQKREDIVGKSFFEAYPENPDAGNAKGHSRLRTSFENAIKNKGVDHIPVLQYDVANAEGDFEARYWRASTTPVLDQDGNVLHIFHSAVEITHQVQAEKAAAELKKMEDKYSLFMQAPVAVCIFSGPDNIVELANEESLRLLDTTSEIVGKPFFDFVNDATDQGVKDLLRKVRETGESFYASEYPIVRVRNGVEEQRFYNFMFKPFLKKQGETAQNLVFSVSHDVTEQVLARIKIEEVKDRLNYRNAFFEALNEATPDGVLIVDEQGKIVLHNRRFSEVWNIPQGIIDVKTTMLP